MRVFVTGANGFVGRNAVRALTDAGHQVVGLVRKPVPNSKSAHYIVGSITDDSSETLAQHMAHCDAVLHLVGIIAEIPSQGQTFEPVHVEGTQNLLTAAKQSTTSIQRFVYVSAVGAAPNGPSEYSRTKAEAERLVGYSGIPYAIFRPSIIIGKHAEFLKQIEQLVTKPPLCPVPLPFIPLPGNGQNRFQPVYIDDLTSCLTRCLSEPQSLSRRFEIGGADEVTFDEMVAAVASELGEPKPILHIPMPLMTVAAAVLESVLPHPPITSDQLPMLSTNNVCDNTAVRETFQISPRPFADSLSLCYTHS